MMRPPAVLAVLPLIFFRPVQVPERQCDIVLRNAVIYDGSGEHTGATPGRIVRGPGWKSPR
jgi:hypothetical protein